MIKFNNQVPSVYPSASRDFQYFSWLIDIVLNSVKHNVDDIYNLPNNKADSKLTELLALTLGFKVKRNYDQNQLSALVAALPRILKYKGTKTAVDMAGNALIAASGVTGEFKSEIKGGELTVTFPVGLIDISLFSDLLNYILPAGMTCHIVRKTEWHRPHATELDYQEKLQAAWVQDLTFDAETRAISGLSSMFDIDNSAPNFANFAGQVPNIGLLDNSIIPILETPLVNQEQEAESEYTTEQNDSGTTVIINKYSTEENDDGTTVIVGGN